MVDPPILSLSLTCAHAHSEAYATIVIPVLFLVVMKGVHGRMVATKVLSVLKTISLNSSRPGNLINRLKRDKLLDMAVSLITC